MTPILAPACLPAVPSDLEVAVIAQACGMSPITLIGHQAQIEFQDKRLKELKRQQEEADNRAATEEPTQEQSQRFPIEGFQQNRAQWTPGIPETFQGEVAMGLKEWIEAQLADGHTQLVDAMVAKLEIFPEPVQQVLRQFQHHRRWP